MAKPLLDRENLREIAKGMVGEEGNGDLPSPKLRKALGVAGDRTIPEIEEIFRDAYQAATGTDDDPFVPGGESFE